MVELKLSQGKAPSITRPFRLPLLCVGPMTKVGVALMLCSDASERLALIPATVALRSMQIFSSVVLTSCPAAMASTPLQLRQFCWSKRAVYTSQ